jgi:UDP-N-acetylglucosamine--N-acetylmuramyl-(pentapeptide) pyrophosphoryl-undecaprenol N-acetylglucosamine transferase
VASTRTFVFAGGGTGGHLFPGLAVAEELRARHPQARITFAGSGRIVEQRILASSGFERLVLPCESLRMARRHPWRFVWNNLRACRMAAAWLAGNSPDVVFGLGGFASAPLVWAAARRNIPVVLLEQNVVVGRATRWLSRRASLICVSFPETAAELGRAAPVCVTGNPVRRSIAALQGGARSERPPELCPGEKRSGMVRTLLVLGGSQGAQAVNQSVLESVAALRASLAGWRIVHQTGLEQADAVERRYRELRVAALVQPFFDDLPEWYRVADLAVARAGATTLAELACAGVPALLVPYPHAARNHQWQNACAFAAAGAARVIEQRSRLARTAADLSRNLLELVDSAGVRDRLRQAMHRLARPRAAASVVEQVETLLSAPVPPASVTAGAATANRPRSAA